MIRSEPESFVAFFISSAIKTIAKLRIYWIRRGKRNWQGWTAVIETLNLKDIIVTVLVT
jgi:hypothetical protein